MLECPCLDKIIINATKISPAEDINAYMRYVMLGLYGEYWLGGEAMLHRWCYSIVELKFLLRNLGFSKVERYEPYFHIKERDMRIVAAK